MLFITLRTGMIGGITNLLQYSLQYVLAATFYNKAVVYITTIVRYILSYPEAKVWLNILH